MVAEEKLDIVVYTPNCVCFLCGLDRANKVRLKHKLNNEAQASALLKIAKENWEGNVVARRIADFDSGQKIIEENFYYHNSCLRLLEYRYENFKAKLTDSQFGETSRDSFSQINSDNAGETNYFCNLKDKLDSNEIVSISHVRDDLNRLLEPAVSYENWKVRRLVASFFGEQIKFYSRHHSTVFFFDQI